MKDFTSFVAKMVFHHSRSLIGNRDMIRLWHLKRGFEDIGYHFIILKDGTIERGRDHRLEGAHAKGKNHDSYGVCLVGDFFQDPPSRPQINSALHLISIGHKRKNIEVVDFHRARDHEKACPGPLFNRDEFQKEIIKSNPFLEVLL